MWRRLFLAYLWVPAVLLLAAGLYASHVVRELYLDHMTADLEARARLCGKPIGDLLAQGQTARIDPLCKELGAGDQYADHRGAPFRRGDRRFRENPRDMDNHRARPARN